jgi:hypothetical protein
MKKAGDRDYNICTTPRCHIEELDLILPLGHLWTPHGLLATEYMCDAVLNDTRSQ